MQRHFYRDLDGSLLEVSAYVQRVEWQSTERAEEGAIGAWTVTLDDPDGELDFNGHRQWFIEETDSEAADDIVFGGFVAAQDVLPWPGRPLGRTWSIELTDANTFWQRVIMKGTDCNRPAETDEERIDWLLNTSEASLVGDTSTYVFGAAAVNMDAHDYRGEYFGQVVGDCAMASGKNWYLWYRKVGTTRTLTAWYAKDSRGEYPSPLYLSNDLADLSVDQLRVGTSLVYPLSADVKLRRDPSRVYCGVYMNYEAGSTYRHSTATHDAFGHRDISVSQPHVKTKTKAQARADRMLADIDDQDLRVTTTAYLPASKVTQLRAGMRVQIKGTHWPDGYDDWHYARVLEASPEPISVGREYRVALELQMIAGEAEGWPPAGDYEGDVFAGLQRSRGNDTDQTGPLKYSSTYEIGGGGWDEVDPFVGPIDIVAGVTNPEADGLVYDSIQVSDSMVVRIHARAHVTGVYIPAEVAVLNVYVNGVLIGTSTVGIGPGFAGGTIVDVDLHDIHLDAGDVVSVDSLGSGLSNAIFWTNNGINDTYLHVGRGTIYSTNGGALVMTGP